MNQQIFQTRSTHSPSMPSPTRRAFERWIDDELAQSFPASDPPSWVSGTIGPESPRDTHDRRPS